jgi:hypothetical protein
MIGEEFAQEKDLALALPAHGFDACVSRVAMVDKYQTVRVECCRYSVPREYAFQSVTVKLYAAHLQVVHGGKVVAEHPRIEQPEASRLEPLHYLPTLLRKPATLDHANVFTAWELPPSFQQLRQTLEHVHGPRAGTRQYIRVLQLLMRHPVERLARALAVCERQQTFTAEIIAEKAAMLAATAALPGASLALLAPTIPQVNVLPPDLRRFDQLLSGYPLTEPQAQGVQNHGHLCPTPGDAAPVPSQDLAITHDAGGVCQAVA